MPSPLVELPRPNRWANLRLLDACAGLSDAQLNTSAPGSCGNVLDTLLHLVAIEARYISCRSSQRDRASWRPGSLRAVARGLVPRIRR